MALSGCSPLSPVSKPTATVETVVEPVVTGDATKILTDIDNRITQTINQVWPWLVAIGIVVLAGCVLIVVMLMMGFWLVRRWIDRRTSENSYVGQFEKIVELKAKACRTNGAKT